MDKPDGDAGVWSLALIVAAIPAMIAQSHAIVLVWGIAGLDAWYPLTLTQMVGVQGAWTIWRLNPYAKKSDLTAATMFVKTLEHVWYAYFTAGLLWVALKLVA